MSLSIEILKPAIDNRILSNIFYKHSYAWLFFIFAHACSSTIFCIPHAHSQFQEGSREIDFVQARQAGFTL